MGACNSFLIQSNIPFKQIVTVFTELIEYQTTLNTVCQIDFSFMLCRDKKQKRLTQNIRIKTTKINTACLCHVSIHSLKKRSKAKNTFKAL